MSLNGLRATPAVSRPQAFEAEGHEGLVMPQTLATLHRPQIPDQAISPAAHPDQPRACKVGFYARQHGSRMHCRVIPSNLDSRESAPCLASSPAALPVGRPPAGSVTAPAGDAISLAPSGIVVAYAGSSTRTLSPPSSPSESASSPPCSRAMVRATLRPRATPPLAGSREGSSR
jgi:hypothetical protein